MASDRDHWRRVAREWTAWARAGSRRVLGLPEVAPRLYRPGHGEALDVGCGEGRISRELKALGFRVTAADAVAEMVQAAAEVGSAHHHIVADAAALPFADGRFRLVAAYHVLMDVDDLPASVREIGRVMAPDGELVVSIVHPFSDRDDFASNEPDAPFILPGTYFGRERVEGVEERNGLRMRFAGWSQPLEAYAAALEAAGLAITALREPRAEQGEGRNHLQHGVPFFLWLKARTVNG